MRHANRSDILKVSTAAKDRLAKLLAGENITIEHRAGIPTAYFDPKGRTMILPIWEDMDSDLYDLFAVHETGHGLFTPADGWHEQIEKKRSKGFQSFLNVLEDARIEKKQKRKYPGARAPMARGYVNLTERGFFGDEKVQANWDALKLIDRINLQTKLGSMVEIAFTAEERVFLNRALANESWDEVVALAEELYKREQGEASTDTDWRPDPNGEDFGEAKEGDESSEPGESGDQRTEEKPEGSSDDADGDAEENGEESPRRRF